MNTGVTQYAARQTGLQRFGQTGYRVMSGLFMLLLALQVFLAGGGLFADPSWWPMHAAFGMALSIVPLLLLPLAFAGRMPKRALWMTALLLVLTVLQPALISVPEKLGLSLISALHPVNAVLIAWVGLLLVQQAWPRNVQPANKFAPKGLTPTKSACAD